MSLDSSSASEEIPLILTDSYVWVIVSQLDLGFEFMDLNFFKLNHKHLDVVPGQLHSHY